MGAGDGMADITTDPFIGPTVLLRPGRWNISGQKRNGGMTSITAIGNRFIEWVLLAVGNRQLKVFDLIPVVSEGHTHHGLGPLHVDVWMTTGTNPRFLVLIVCLGPQGFFAGRKFLSKDKTAQKEQQEKDE